MVLSHLDQQELRSLTGRRPAWDVNPACISCSLFLLHSLGNAVNSSIEWGRSPSLSSIAHPHDTRQARSHIWDTIHTQDRSFPLLLPWASLHSVVWGSHMAHSPISSQAATRCLPLPLPYGYFGFHVTTTGKQIGNILRDPSLP